MLRILASYLMALFMSKNIVIMISSLRCVTAIERGFKLARSSNLVIVLHLDVILGMLFLAGKEL